MSCPILWKHTFEGFFVSKTKTEKTKETSTEDIPLSSMISLREHFLPNTLLHFNIRKLRVILRGKIRVLTRQHTRVHHFDDAGMLWIAF